MSILLGPSSHLAIGKITYSGSRQPGGLNENHSFPSPPRGEFQISGLPDQRRIGTVDLWPMNPRQHRSIMMSQRKSQRAAESYDRFGSLDMKIPSYLPGSAVIVAEGKVGDMICIWQVVRFLISPESQQLSLITLL
jgi:hypothetical protein